jgi:hypothetical protein
MNTTPIKTSRSSRAARSAPVESYSFTRIMEDGTLAQSSGFSTWNAAARHIDETYRTYSSKMRSLAMVSSIKWPDGHLEFRVTNWVGVELAEIAGEAARVASIR